MSIRVLTFKLGNPNSTTRQEHDSKIENECAELVKNPSASNLTTLVNNAVTNIDEIFFGE